MKDFPIFHNAKTLPLKQKLFERLPQRSIATGTGPRILEIGAGSGANLQFYPDNTRLIVVDPNPFFRKHLEENLKKYPNITLEDYIVSGSESMNDVPDDSIDAVVSTLVLCSCTKPQEVYKEIRRVLVPGGKFYFMEHVLDETLSAVKCFQILVSRLGIFPFLVDGCKPDRDTEQDLRKGPFKSVEVKRFRLDLSEGVPWQAIMVYAIVPHLYGTATI